MAGDYGLTQFQFDPEQDLKAYRVWVANLVHIPVPWTPLSMWLWCDGSSWAYSYGAEKTSLPQEKGLDCRLIDGYYYLAVKECRPEEVPEREKVFREKIRPILEDYEGEWNRSMGEWLPVLDHFKQLCLPERLKQLSDIQLWELFEDYLVRLHRGWWSIHFLWLYPIYSCYNLFTDLCQELTGIDLEHPMFKKLLTGFDNALFHLNQGLWQLGEKARALGLDSLFLTTKDDEKLTTELEASDAGRKWSEAYRELLNTYGWQCRGMYDIADPTWIEKPSLGLPHVRMAIRKGGAFTLEEMRERLAKERAEAEKEILAKVPEAQRDWFTKLMGIAEISSPWSEEHGVIMDTPATAIGRHVFMEYGRRFAQAGVIDNQNDILFLFPWDIRKAAIAMERINLRPYVNMRREEWERNLKVKPEPFIGDISVMPEVARKDPIFRIVGVPPRVRPELKADLYGGSSTPGVVEGIARVMMSETELDQIQPGEILVARMTCAPWTPVFGVISGLVTDAGSSLAHSAIVAREYGLPAVVGTQEGTRKIKSGDRIRVDGDNGCVYILGK